jgi:CspA family cold shock protein
MKFFDRIVAFFSSKEGESTSQKLKKGSIDFFNRSRGYGFIKSREFSNRIFVHIKDINDRFRVGDPVQFEVERNEKGFIARNVRKLATDKA